MNIFDLSVEEIKIEFQKILDSYSDEEFIKALKEVGFKFEEIKEDNSMKNEIFYVLMNKKNLTYHLENGYETDDLMQALRFATDKIALKYLLEEIDEDAQEEFEIYKIDMHIYFALVEKENIQ